ncbi:aldo/keto reductase [Saccharothrix sp. ALI-22-I]|uniref:aldo/keto reductase n=1 Tax=Saccharothrix sp. ALI-22-I TaxID=1933778 RepID=UPI002377F2F8|nr:aldo/keto reductase [Saccharothrix sp. ALI-22-I]
MGRRRPRHAYTALVRAHELGITLFDTADVYGLGRSERLLGRLLRHVDRDGLVVSSKVGYFAGTGRHPYHPRQMSHQLATTLDNLGTDHLDVYFLHSTDFGEHDQYLTGVVDLLGEWRDQGLIRAVGMRAPHTFAEQWADHDEPESTETGRFLRLFHTVRPDVFTARYNLLSPLYSPDQTDIFAFARRHRVGVLIKQALGQGLLIGTHNARDPRRFSDTDHRRGDPRFAPDGLRRLADRLAPLRARYGTSTAALARVALRYALQHAPDSIVLVGFRDPEQIHTDVTCLGDPLTDDEIAQIRATLHPDTPEGDP